MKSKEKLNRFKFYAWGVVIYTLLIILWGAYVRATGSGAGCGRHWPTCHGQIIPRPESIETVIEYTHRITSAALGILIIILVVWAWRLFGRQAKATRYAIWSFVFVIVEGLLGAGLVLFELVAQDSSVARAVAMGIHLVNTLILLGFITLTAWSAARPDTGSLQGERYWDWAIFVALVGIAVVGAIGAVTALGDTLFPAETFLQGAAAKFEPGAHFAVKMRTWHPTVAVAVSLYTAILIYTTDRYWETAELSVLSRFTIGIIMTQIVAGFVNVLLAAPITMQLLHLLLADLCWIALILLFAAVKRPENAVQTVRTAQTLG